MSPLLSYFSFCPVPPHLSALVAPFSVGLGLHPEVLGPYKDTILSSSYTHTITTPGPSGTRPS
eukprot:753676-Hanusia_phi.AAC.11